MMTLAHENTLFVFLVDSYATVVGGINILRNLLQSRRKVFSSCIRVPYDYNVFSIQKIVTRLHLVRIYGDGRILVDTPFGPLMADNFTRLTDAHEVIKYLCGKSKTKDYKVVIIYLPLILPLIKRYCVIEGPLEYPDVISYLVKLRPLAKRWALSLADSHFIRPDLF